MCRVKRYAEKCRDVQRYAASVAPKELVVASWSRFDSRLFSEDDENRQKGGDLISEV